MGFATPVVVRRFPGTLRRTARTSPGVVDQPTETRSERSASTPIAASTGEGSSVSDEHDEPLCTATPCWSSANRIGSASTPSTPRHSRLGRVRAGSSVPYRSTPATPSVTLAAAATSVRCSAALRGRIGRRACRAEPDPRGNVLDAGAPRALLRAADHQRVEAQPPPNQQRARALRSAELVRGDRAQIDVERAEVDRDVARGRARVDVHDGAALARGRADLGDRLERPDLVIRELHRHELGVGRGWLPSPRPRRSGRCGRLRCTSCPRPSARSRHARSSARPRWSPRGPDPGSARARPRPRC